MIIFNNPNNPSGLIYTNDEVQNCIILKSIIVLYYLMKYIITKYDWTKIHSPYYDNVIAGNSLSKFYGGYRFGWLKFPKS